MISQLHLNGGDWNFEVKIWNIMFPPVYSLKFFLGGTDNQRCTLIFLF